MRQFNTALVAKLDGSTDLQTLLRSGLGQGEEVPALERSDRTPRDYRIWEAGNEVHNIFNQAGDRWVTFEVVQDDPEPIQQTSEVRDIAVLVHVWCREPDSGPAEDIDETIRVLLDESTLEADDFHAWWLLEDPFYVRENDTDVRAWHIVRRYSGLCRRVVVP